MEAKNPPQQKISDRRPVWDNDRVKRHTAPAVNRRIEERIQENVRVLSGRGVDAVNRRLERLENEWDIERFLEMGASAIAFTGLVLGLLRKGKRGFLWLPRVVLPFLFQHATQGWCPPLPVLRRLGVRTQQEIDREKYLLKALRGDYANVRPIQKSGGQSAPSE